MSLTMLGEFAVFRLYVTLICSFFTYFTFTLSFAETKVSDLGLRSDVNYERLKTGFRQSSN